MSRWNTADSRDVARAMIVDEYGPDGVSWADYLRGRD
jgi:hypothetical protein